MGSLGSWCELGGCSLEDPSGHRQEDAGACVGDTFHRRPPRSEHSSPRWVFSGASSKGTFPTLHISTSKSPFLSGSSVTRRGQLPTDDGRRCPASCPHRRVTGSGTKDRVSFLSVFSVQGLGTKMFMWREAFSNHTPVTITGRRLGAGGGGRSEGQALFIPHLLLRGSGQKYANVFLHFPCLSPVSPPKLNIEKGCLGKRLVPWRQGSGRWVTSKGWVPPNPPVGPGAPLRSTPEKGHLPEAQGQA